MLRETSLLNHSSKCFRSLQIYLERKNRKMLVKMRVFLRKTKTALMMMKSLAKSLTFRKALSSRLNYFSRTLNSQLAKRRKQRKRQKVSCLDWQMKARKSSPSQLFSLLLEETKAICQISKSKKSSSSTFSFLEWPKNSNQRRLKLASRTMNVPFGPS
jgi:hypothetical protein